MTDQPRPGGDRMLTLLERWSRLEPERCYRAAAAVQGGQPLYRWCLPLDGKPSYYWGGAMSNAAVLAAVIEAVNVRGWLWQMGRLPCLDYWARVWDLGPDGEHVDRMNCADGDPFRAHAQEPAEALLTAYLAALASPLASTHYGSASATGDGKGTDTSEPVTGLTGGER